jgi:hypothetical protein
MVFFCCRIEQWAGNLKVSTPTDLLSVFCGNNILNFVIYGNNGTKMC